MADADTETSDASRSSTWWLRWAWPERYSAAASHASPHPRAEVVCCPPRPRALCSGLAHRWRTPRTNQRPRPPDAAGASSGPDRCAGLVGNGWSERGAYGRHCASAVSDPRRPGGVQRSLVAWLG